MRNNKNFSYYSFNFIWTLFLFCILKVFVPYPKFDLTKVNISNLNCNTIAVRKGLLNPTGGTTFHHIFLTILLCDQDTSIHI